MKLAHDVEKGVVCNKACEKHFFVQGMHRIADLPRTGLDTVLRVAAKHIGLIEVAYAVPHMPAHTRTHRECTLAHTTSEKIEGPGMNPFSGISQELSALLLCVCLLAAPL